MLRLALALFIPIGLLVTTTPAISAESVRGRVLLLPRCPGDQTKLESVDEVGGLAAAIFTPIISGIVTQGMKAWGTKLKESAEEASFDVIHRGSHLYRYQKDKDKEEVGGKFKLDVSCVVIASKGVVESKDGLSNVTAGYLARNVTGTSADPQFGWIDGASSLKAALDEVGFDRTRPPAVLAVFDVQLSSQATEARLVPRFISMNHSVREKRADKKERTITFEVLIESPLNEKAIANLVVKIDGLLAGSAFVNQAETDTDPHLSSEWFAMPALSTAAAARLEASSELAKAKIISISAAKLAGSAAVALGDNGPGNYLQEEGVPCPVPTIAMSDWVSRRNALSVEQAKPEAIQDTQILARLNAGVLYYKSCVDYHDYSKRLIAAQLTAHDRAGPFDLTVTMKEFRERPFAKFFGAVLASDAVSGGVAAAVASKFDPAKTEADEKARIALREAYETAVVAAETAIAAYDGASDAEKPAKFIDMEAKKRSANRKARELSLPIPYPDSGFWL